MFDELRSASQPALGVTVNSFLEVLTNKRLFHTHRKFQTNQHALIRMMQLAPRFNLYAILPNPLEFSRLDDYIMRENEVELPIAGVLCCPDEDHLTAFMAHYSIVQVLHVRQNEGTFGAYYEGASDSVIRNTIVAGWTDFVDTLKQMAGETDLY